MRLEVKPLTPSSWSDLEQLFGPKGACAGCWCMFWRLEEGERFDDVKGAKAKRRFRALVEAGKALGALAYADGVPVGWVAYGPRRDFAKLDRAPSLPCDNADAVWSVPCFFIKAGFRGQGVATALLRHAVDAADPQRAKVLEGYPVKVASGARSPAAFAYTGTVRLFEKQGFSVVQPRATGKQRMRRPLGRRHKGSLDR